MTDASLPENIWINRGGSQFNAAARATIEKHYEATYIADLCIRDKRGNWTETTVAVFWVEEPKQADHSHYIGLYRSQGRVMICDARSVAEGHWDGMMAEDGEIIFSRYRHDYRRSRDDSVMVDGGRDYFKASGLRDVRINIVRDKMWVNDVLSYPVRGEDDE